MKKLATLLMIFVSVGAGQLAIAQANTKWNIVTDPYYGFPNFSNAFSGFKNSPLGKVNNDSDNSNISSAGVGPTGLRTEFLLANWIGIGVDAIYSGTHIKYDEAGTDANGLPTVTHIQRNMDRVRIQARFNFHFKIKSPHLDMYGGVGIGSNTRYTKYFRDGIEVNDNTGFWKQTLIPVSARMCFGMRFYITKFVGLHFELGIGGPLISTGISTRFGIKIPKKPAFEGQ